MKNTKKTGILGGTFNPIHNAHIHMALCAKNALGLDNILIIPANDPPHKIMEDNVPVNHRAAMAKIAVSGVEGLCLSDIESARKGKSYTVDTIARLKDQNPNTDYYIIVGSDMLADLKSWHKANELFKMAAFVGVKRKGHEVNEEQTAQELKTSNGADVRLIPDDIPAISSTAVRKMIKSALPVGDIINPGVEQYIYENALYFPDELSAIHKKVKSMLSEKKFIHTAGVMIKAVELAKIYGVDGHKARLCALLHDLGKSADKGELTHGLYGAKLAEEIFNINDEDILNAISLHTTLCKYPTALMKITYLADKTEKGRKYNGVEEIRDAANKDLNKAIELALTQTINYVKSLGKKVDNNSVDALEEIIKTRRQQKI